MSKKFSRAQLRKIIISEIKELTSNRSELVQLNEGLPSNINMGAGDGESVASDDRLRSLGQQLLTSDASRIVNVWKNIMRHYIGPMMTKVMKGRQNDDFILIDFVGAGMVPTRTGSKLIGYHPWVPAGGYNTWPFRPQDLLREAMADPNDPVEKAIETMEQEREEAEAERNLRSLMRPEENEEEAESGLDDDSEEETSRTIPVVGKSGVSGYAYLPGVMMPWLSQRARAEILWRACLNDEAVGPELEEEGGWGNCNHWTRRWGWGLSLARESTGAVWGQDWEWQNELVTDSWARETVQTSMTVLVNSFLRNYGPWSTYYRYTSSDFEVTTDTAGWGDSGDPPTAVVCWMKLDSMFKNHDDE